MEVTDTSLAPTPTPLSSSLPPLPPPPSMPKSKDSQKRKPPTPEELVAMYEAEGLDNREASLKVINDLQTVLHRVAGLGKVKQDRFMAETSRKLDNANTRLAILEMKVDSKPGFSEVLALGVAAGGVLRGITGAAPHVLAAFSQMLSSVRSSTRT